jgi:hypothetical protein
MFLFLLADTTYVRREIDRERKKKPDRVVKATSNGSSGIRASIF